MILVRTDVSEKLIASIIRVTRIFKLGKTLEVISERNTLRRKVTANVVANPPIFVTLMMQATHYSETSVLTIATRRRILENGIPKCQ
jgi:hypothetical protein